MLHGGVAAPGVVHLYGIDVRAPWPMEGVASSNRDRWDVEFVEGNQATFAAASALVPAEQAGRWAQSAELPDGSSYRRWAGLFEFLVTSDARRVYARTFDDPPTRRCWRICSWTRCHSRWCVWGGNRCTRPRWSTARGAAGFLGQSGDGKSTLAALFLRHGGALVTDDMLVLTGPGRSVRRGARAAADQAVPRDGRARSSATRLAACR